MSTRIETIAIGDELLTGKIADTNSAFVANELFNLGLRLQRQNVVADLSREIQNILKEVSARSDFAVVFGGLGPTSDDKTAETVSHLLNTPLIEEPAAKSRLYQRYQERNREVTKEALKQVLYPKGTKLVINQRGMAPGFEMVLGGCRFFFLPGVPSEMRPMFLEQVLKEIRIQVEASGFATGVLSHTWRCLGIWESDLQRVMNSVEAKLPEGAWLGYRTKFPENHLSLYWKENLKEGKEGFQRACVEIRNLLSRWTYTETKKELEELIHDQCMAQGLTLALAESCTGGKVAERLVRVSGSSHYFWGSYVVYQVGAKASMLNVNLSNPQEAVSESTSELLAKATLEQSKCSVAAAITGYLGPTGATDSDPLGTLYCCVLSQSRKQNSHFIIIFFCINNFV
jgi:nicotinamide-nucleotide amidase